MSISYKLTLTLTTRTDDSKKKIVTHMKQKRWEIETIKNYNSDTTIYIVAYGSLSYSQTEHEFVKQLSKDVAEIAPKARLVVELERQENLPYSMYDFIAGDTDIEVDEDTFHE